MGHRGKFAISVAFASLSLILLAVPPLHSGEPAGTPVKEVPPGETIRLPSPRLIGVMSVEAAIASRRSQRSYRKDPLTMEDISQVLWAAQGVTDPEKGLRAAPSARALFLLQIYLFAGEVTGLPKGMYRYRPEDHSLVRTGSGDAKTELFEAAGQRPIKEAPAAILIAGIASRTSNPIWMYLEAGHAAQNVYLQATVQDMGTVVMAGFPPDKVRKTVSLPENEQPIYIMPLGKRIRSGD